MKKQILISTFLGALLVTGAAQAASWQESLSSAANELTKESSSTQGGLSASSLTSLLSNSSQSLSAGTMNNAAGILEYCAKQKLASVTDAQNVKNQVLGKLGLDTQEQKADTSYMDGIQGLLNAQNGQQLNLSTLGNSSLAKQVKTKACDSLASRRETSVFPTCHRLSVRLSGCDLLHKNDFLNQILTTAHFRDTKIAAKRHRHYIV